ncbi:MAG: hypothetical protein ACPHSF_04405, partial [Flavobacteriales bacterium]
EAWEENWRKGAAARALKDAAEEKKQRDLERKKDRDLLQKQMEKKLKQIAKREVKANKFEKKIEKRADRARKKNGTGKLTRAQLGIYETELENLAEMRAEIAEDRKKILFMDGKTAMASLQKPGGGPKDTKDFTYDGNGEEDPSVAHRISNGVQE